MSLEAREWSARELKSAVEERSGNELLMKLMYLTHVGFRNF